jgi:hypothetical protein
MDLCVFAACLQYSTSPAIIMDNIYNNAALSSLCPRAMHALVAVKGTMLSEKNAEVNFIWLQKFFKKLTNGMYS